MAVGLRLLHFLLVSGPPREQIALCVAYPAGLIGVVQAKVEYLLVENIYIPAEDAVQPERISMRVRRVCDLRLP